MDVVRVTIDGVTAAGQPCGRAVSHSKLFLPFGRGEHLFMPRFCIEELVGQTPECKAEGRWLLTKMSQRRRGILKRTIGLQASFPPQIVYCRLAGDALSTEHSISHRAAKAAVIPSTQPLEASQPALDAYGSDFAGAPLFTKVLH